MAENSTLVNNVVCIQALVRGHLVRKRLKEVRTSFRLIALELEGHLQIQWPLHQSFGPPIITREFEGPFKGSFESRQKSEQEQVATEDFKERENTTSTSTTIAKTMSAAEPLMQGNIWQENDTVLERGAKCTDTPMDCLREPDIETVMPTSPVDVQLDSFASRNRNYHSSVSDSWMTDTSFDPVQTPSQPAIPLQADNVQLREMRDQIALELLWTKQAIESRKKYLRLRKRIGSSTEQKCQYDQG